VDRRLLNVRLPSECSRGTRSVNDRAHYKANEYRSILFYLAFGILKDILPDKYLLNLVKYIVFIRILCSEKVSNEDCNDAIVIFDDYHSEYQNLYGKENMTFNLHAHSHYPKQVMEFGQINMRSGFCFENKFHHTSNKFHGTANFEGQIARNLDRRQQIIIEIRELKNRANNLILTKFIDEIILGEKSRQKEDQLIKFQSLSILKLKDFEMRAIRKSNLNIDNSTIVHTSCSAYINLKGMTTFLIVLIKFKF
jgi:hypothetical protein